MRRILKASQALALLFFIALSSLFYNNCSGPKVLLGTSVALYTPKSNLSSASSSASDLYQPGGAIGASSLTSNPNIQGVFEGIRGDVVLGWACVVKKAAATKINIYVDGVQYAEIMTSTDSESAISDATHCNAAFSKNRFFYRFKEDQSAAFAGKVVTVFATDPSNISQSAQLSVSSTASVIGLRPLWYSKLPTGFSGSPIASPLVATLTGLWESTVVNADGSIILSGWACSVGSASAVALSVYTAQNEFVKTFETNLTMSPSETSSINSACASGASTGTLRRFSTRIQTAQALQFQTKDIHISLAEPFVSGVAYSTLPRAAGVSSVIPTPAASTTGGSAPGSNGGTSSGSNTGGSSASSGSNWICSPTSIGETCNFAQHCSNAAPDPRTGAPVYVYTGVQTFNLSLNISGDSSNQQQQATAATIGNTSVTGYTLSDISGLKFMCLSNSTTKTAAWFPTEVNVACNVIQELPATDTKCCPKDRNGNCLNPSTLGAN